MPILDKNDLLPRLAEIGNVALELGCGATKREPDSIGIDAIDQPGVDIVGDVFEVLRRIPTGSVDSVATYHFVEHVDDLPGLMNELGRVMRDGAKLIVVVPHFSNPYFYSDYTHRRFFGLYTFCYLCRSALFRRAVPSYGVKPQFALQDVYLAFKSSRPFYVRHALKKVLGVVFNASRGMQEWYEENACWLFPCYEVRYTLTRSTRAEADTAAPSVPERP